MSQDDDNVALAKYTEKRIREAFAYFRLPSYMLDGLLGHVLHGREPGSFLRFLLCGQYMNATTVADTENAQALYGWFRLLDASVPYEAYGCVDAANAWRAHRGLFGQLGLAP